MLLYACKKHRQEVKLLPGQSDPNDPIYKIDEQMHLFLL
jgi:hypothetical protein